MTKEQKLRSEARNSATWRGHKMEKKWIISLFHGRKRQSLKCKNCLMHAIIDLKPAPNDIEIGGQAVASHCPGN